MTTWSFQCLVVIDVWSYNDLSPSHWCYNDHDGVSNHQPHSCLLNRLMRRRSKKTSKLRVTGLCGGNSPGPVNSPHKGPVTRKMVPFHDVICLHQAFYLDHCLLHSTQYWSVCLGSYFLGQIMKNQFHLWSYFIPSGSLVWFCYETARFHQNRYHQMGEFWTLFEFACFHVIWCWIWMVAYHGSYYVL